MRELPSFHKNSNELCTNADDLEFLEWYWGRRTPEEKRLIGALVAKTLFPAKTRILAGELPVTLIPQNSLRCTENEWPAERWRAEFEAMGLNLVNVTRMMIHLLIGQKYTLTWNDAGVWRVNIIPKDWMESRYNGKYARRKW